MAVVRSSCARPWRARIVWALLSLTSCGADPERRPSWALGSWEPDWIATEARTHAPAEARALAEGLAQTFPGRFMLRADGTGTATGPAFGLSGKTVSVRWVAEGATIKVKPVESHAGPLDLTIDARTETLSYRVPLTEQVIVLRRAAEAPPGGAKPGALSVGDDPPMEATSLWTTVVTVDELKEHLTAARDDGKPVVARVWAAWCTYCTGYDELIKQDTDIRQALRDVVLLQIDVTSEERKDLRDVLGMPHGQQPFIVFVNRRGRVLRHLDIGRGSRRDELLRGLEVIRGR